MPTKCVLLSQICARCALAGRLRRVESPCRNARGNTLVGVMAISTAVLLVGIAIFVLGHAEGDIVEHAVDDARAFYVAEGGLERARGWLGDLMVKDPGANPVGMCFEDQTLGGGSYSVSVEDRVSGFGWLPAFEVVSTGELDGVQRQVRSVMVAETFARFQWFVERGGWKWFGTGERFEGPVHVNADLQVDGDPWFGARVYAGGHATIKVGSDPTFEDGYELHVEQIPLPGDDYLDGVLKAAALNGGRYVGSLPAGAFYLVGLGHYGHGTLTYVGVTGSYGHITQITIPRTVDLSTLNGAMWFDAPIAIAGTLDGQLTIGVNGNIEIWDDIVYYDATPYGGPNPGCDDVLGLIAAGHPYGDVIIKYTPPNRHDCVIHAVMMALQKNIEAEDYMHYPPRGDIVIYGGMIADYSIHMGEFSQGVCISGYNRDYRNDARLFSMPPPFFPLTGHYMVYSWEEVKRPEA
ncbi:MAG: DUF4900 domain-containing protein [Candidatus Eisenbacteria bacterium]|nr:DUF4900 domain-containing protein [Candidatus Eisenbacteria bacterium]